MTLGHALEHRKDIQTPVCSSFFPFFCDIKNGKISHIQEVHKKVKNLQRIMIIYERHLIFCTNWNFIGAPKRRIRGSSYIHGRSLSPSNTCLFNDKLVFTNLYMLFTWIFILLMEKISAFIVVLLYISGLYIGEGVLERKQVKRSQFEEKETIPAIFESGWMDRKLARNVRAG